MSYESTVPSMSLIMNGGQAKVRVYKENYRRGGTYGTFVPLIDDEYKPSRLYIRLDDVLLGVLKTILLDTGSILI